MMTNTNAKTLDSVQPPLHAGLPRIGIRHLDRKGQSSCPLLFFVFEHYL